MTIGISSAVRWGLTAVELAAFNLIQTPCRLLVSLAGVAFAVFLIFVQYGFRNALFDSTISLLSRLNADLVMVSPRKVTLASSEPFSRRRLAQARAVAGVANVEPLYIEFHQSIWTSPLAGEPNEGGSSRVIRAVALDPEANLLNGIDTRSRAGLLRRHGSVMYDTESKAIYGPLHAPINLARRDIVFAGGFAMGTDFAAEGNVILSEQDYAERFRTHPVGNSLWAVELGAIQLTPGADRTQVARQLRAVLPNDVVIMTRQELITQEIAFWDRCTPIGAVFGLGMSMGFIVGVVICFQVLSTAVSDRLPEYATLKAIGHTPRFLMMVVLAEAGLLAFAGFFPGWLTSWLLFRVLASWTGLPLMLTPGRVSFVLALTLVMCGVSGLFALRKVRSADPAEVFG